MKKLLIIVLLCAFALSFTATVAVGEPDKLCWYDECVYYNGSWVWYMCCEWWTPGGQYKSECYYSSIPCNP